MRIRFPELQLEPRQAGHPKSMMVTFGQGRRVNADVRLQVDGEKISGTAKLKFSQVSLHLDSLCELAGGDDTRLRLNQVLHQLDQFDANLTIGGTVNDHRVSVESDLGTRLADLAQSAVVERMVQQNKSQLDSLRAAARGEGLAATAEIRSQLIQLVDQLDRNSTSVAQLKQNLQSVEETGWTRLR